LEILIEWNWFYGNGNVILGNGNVAENGNVFWEWKCFLGMEREVVLWEWKLKYNGSGFLCINSSQNINIFTSHWTLVKAI